MARLRMSSWIFKVTGGLRGQPLILIMSVNFVSSQPLGHGRACHSAFPARLASVQRANQTTPLVGGWVLLGTLLLVIAFSLIELNDDLTALLSISLFLFVFGNSIRIFI